MAGGDLLIPALRRPEALPRLPPADWDRLVRQAREAGLLARLATVLRDAAALDAVPDGPRAHLDAACVLAAAQHAEVRREVALLRRLFAPMGVPVTLLKGAAYLTSGRRAGRGRLFADIDVLVPRTRLPEVEAALMLDGWATTHHSPYDQRYYREWMHELPPMRHVKRGTSLDVHHAILPLTARSRPDSGLLLAAARPAADDPDVRVLAPADMILHSMSHLFHNEEMSHGLRDLSDLDLLLREFDAEPGFWVELVARSRALDLRRPLFWGLRYTRVILGTPVPDDVIAASASAAPPAPMVRGMDMLYRRALHSHHPTAALPGTAAALLALYVRAHWLRMPPLMLARHLATKAVMRTESSSAA